MGTVELQTRDSGGKKKMTEGRERVWPLGVESFVRWWCCEVTRVAGVEITYILDSSCSESQ